MIFVFKMGEIEDTSFGVSFILGSVQQYLFKNSENKFDSFFSMRANYTALSIWHCTFRAAHTKIYLKAGGILLSLLNDTRTGGSYEK